jgi:hypothetical protein
MERLPAFAEVSLSKAAPTESAMLSIGSGLEPIEKARPRTRANLKTQPRPLPGLLLVEIARDLRSSAGETVHVISEAREALRVLQRQRAVAIPIGRTPFISATCGSQGGWQRLAQLAQLC